MCHEYLQNAVDVVKWQSDESVGRCRSIVTGREAKNRSIHKSFC